MGAARCLLVAAGALAACSSSKKKDDPPTAGSGGATASGTAAGVGATPDAAPPACVDIQPWGTAADTAGLRPLAHHSTHVEDFVPRVPAEEVVTAPIGSPKVIPDLPAATDGSAPEESWIEYKGRKVVVTAPLAVAGSVLTISASQGNFSNTRRVAFGTTGATAYLRYASVWETPTRGAPYEPTGDHKTWTNLHRLIAADVDGDGVDELVAHVFLGEDKPQPSGGGVMLMEGADLALVVIWADGHTAAVTLARDGLAPVPLYVVPAALSGGAPLLFGLDGTRVRIAHYKLERLADDTPQDQRAPGADLAAQLGAVTGEKPPDAAAVDAAPPPLSLARAKRICLQTSPTAPARLVPIE
jgi:hypothetical protein